MHKFLLVTFLGLVATLGGCEKAGAKSSGPLAAEDLSLFHDLPGGNVALIGGNYMKMQDFMQSSLGQLTQRLMDKATSHAEGFAKWMKCFTEIKDLRIAGGVALAKGVEARLVFKGMSVQQIDACAKRAGYERTLDPDGKYIAVKLPGVGSTTMEAGYLQLPDGALYSRQRFEIALVPTVAPAARGELEADVAGLAKASAADDKALLALAAKVDRTKTMWFTGSGANTPAASKVGDVYGSIDIDSGIKLDITVAFKDQALAKQIEDGLAQARKMSDRMPAEVRSLLDHVELHRDGGTVRFVANVTDTQLKALTQLSGAF